MAETRPQWYHCRECGTSLNYEPNTVKWSPGSLVIHDKDAKKERLLLEVGTTAKVADGHIVRVKYISIPEDELPPEVRGWFRNPLCVLHDPKRFNIEVPTEKGEPHP